VFPLTEYRQGERYWLSINDIARQANCKETVFPFRGKLRIQCGEEDLYITRNNPFVILNSQSYAYSEAITQWQGHYWLSMPEGAALLDSLLPWHFQWNPQQAKLLAQPMRDLLDFQVDKRSNGTVAELNFSRKIQYEQFFQRPWLILRLNGAELDTASLRKSFPEGLIVSSFAEQNENSAQITMKVRNNASDQIDVIPRDGGKRLQLVVRPKTEKKVQEAKAEKKKSGRRVQNIIIDAGHGGKDPGALGSFAQEKDITLAVAQKLAEKLKKAGLNPKLTRDSDTFLGLKERPAMAAKWEGDLFISLHCNAIDAKPERKKKVNGFKIFILREAKSEEDKALARRENQAIMLSEGKHSKTDISPVQWILLEHQLNLYTKESERLTGHMVDSMARSSIRKHGTGASQAGFYVLVGAFMPAVLVEMGFITNPDDEKHMASSKGQYEIAERLKEAVLSYKSEVEGI